MSKGITGPTEGPLTATGGRMTENKITRFGLGFRHNPLLQSYSVGQCRARQGPVKSGSSHRNQQDRHGENYSKPESGGAHHVDRGAEVGVVEELGVECKRKTEVEQDASPDDEVVETGPV